MIQNDRPANAERPARAFDFLLAAALFLIAFILYWRTLAPTITFVFDDSLEFQLLAWRAAIAHPTGYPFYSLLLTLVARLVPLGDVAFRTNLFSAFCASLAIVLIYLAARQIPISNPLASFLAALTFAVGSTFWSQAIITEVYALHTLLTAAIIFLALRLRPSPDHPLAKSRTFVALAFLGGLSLTHHRMSALNLPALGVYILFLDKNIWRNLRALVRPLLAFVTPFALFLYLPLRGITSGSLDGTYQNTLSGFFDWVTGASYTVFLTQNPFNELRDASFYVNLFSSELTWLGIALAVVGFFVLFISKNSRRVGVLLTLAFAANFLFALNYRVADVQVFFIPAFLFASLFIAAGLGFLTAKTLRRQPENPTSIFHLAPLRLGDLRFPFSILRLAQIIFLLVAFIVPYSLFNQNYEAVRLADKYDVSDEGRAELAQPLPDNATLIGILGEMTRVRYFQETQGLQPQVETVAADQEDARLQAIDSVIKNGRVVFLTRKLSNVEKKYSLTSYGSLIRVQSVPNKSTPAPSHALNENFDGVTLVGYDLDTSRLQDSPNWHLDNGRQIRVTLYWRVDTKITNDRFVSIKLVDAGGQRAAQLDRHPVLDAYPTTAWRVGEFIADTYDVPIFAGVAAGDYALQVTLYDPDSGHVHGEKVLDTIQLDPDTQHHRASDEALSVDEPVYRNWSGATLVGYSFDSGEAYAPGDSIPFTFVWYLTDTNLQSPFGIQLLDTRGNVAHAQYFSLADLKATRDEYTRQEFGFVLPSALSAGKYSLRLVEWDCLTCEWLADLSPLPLGEIEIKK